MAVVNRARYRFEDKNRLQYIDGVGWETLQYIGFMNGISAECADKETVNAANDLFVMLCDSNNTYAGQGAHKAIVSAAMLQQVINSMIASKKVAKAAEKIAEKASTVGNVKDAYVAMMDEAKLFSKIAHKETVIRREKKAMEEAKKQNERVIRELESKHETDPMQLKKES
ncbi:MAG: hypothetical protein K6A23_13300 [Butyrivibrio sp.]|nr:hypothetical protein [Butyrivibrio sp.]